MRCCPLAVAVGVASGLPAANLIIWPRVSLKRSGLGVIRLAWDERAARNRDQGKIITQLAVIFILCLPAH